MIRKRLICGTLALLLAGVIPQAQAGELLDRIVATVNGAVILQSDWNEAVRYEAFIAGHPPGQAGISERKAALDRLIDQELLREQMQSSDFPRATTGEISQQMQQIRKLYPGAETDSGWREILQRYRLTENQLKDRITLQLNLMRLVDVRMRPKINIDHKSIESYYSQELLPQLRQQGAKAAPLAEFTPKIKELLTQRKVSQLLTAWLQDLRADSNIHTMLPPVGGGDQAQ
jgi:peptidyl-prolyl cis-trans isomerase SurA